MTGTDPHLRILAATAAGDPSTPNEDRVDVRGNLVLVMDGLTTRTDTGCVHGVPWYVERLAAGILANSDAALRVALSQGIQRVSDLHRVTCDLSSPGTPSAAIAALRTSGDRTEYLVLGDTTIVIDSKEQGLVVVSDRRIRTSAAVERHDANQYPIGSTLKREAMVRMKRAELGERNTPGGYWVAAADPAVVDQSVVGTIPTADVTRAAVVTDGVSRLVEDFDAMTWGELLDLVSTSGPEEVIRAVRSYEDRDPLGTTWPRNKKSDDASIAYISTRGPDEH